MGSIFCPRAPALSVAVPNLLSAFPATSNAPPVIFPKNPPYGNLPIVLDVALPSQLDAFPKPRKAVPAPLPVKAALDKAPNAVPPTDLSPLPKAAPATSLDLFVLSSIVEDPAPVPPPVVFTVVVEPFISQELEGL